MTVLEEYKLKVIDLRSKLNSVNSELNLLKEKNNIEFGVSIK